MIRDELKTLESNRVILVDKKKEKNLSFESRKNIDSLLDLFEKVKRAILAEKENIDILIERLPLLYLQIKRV
jgi:hypothetical protein